MRRATLAIVFLVALNAAASSITSLNPSSIQTKSGEYFMTVNGTDLGDQVVFDGPAGHFELEINSAFPGNVTSWVPLDIVNTPGTYSVFVRGGRVDSNPLNFNVFKPGRPIFKIHLPELLLEPAKTRLGTIIKYEVSATDPEGLYSIQCDPKSGSTFPFGASTIRCFGSDESGQKDSGEISVNVFDGESPSLTLPKDFEVPGDLGEGAFVKYETLSFDEIDGELRANCLPESGKLFPNGRTTVRCEAVDTSLNPTYGSFQVMVQPKDPGRLELRVPADLKVPADFKEGAYVDFEVVAFGSADPDPVVTCEPASGSFFPVGLTKVFCTAVDDFDQRAEGGFTLEVTEFTDLKMADVSAEAMSSGGAEVTFAPEVEGWDAEITCSPASGSLFAMGATSVECESTNESGRRAVGAFTVLVADTIAPHISRIDATAGSVDRDRQVVPLAVAVEASDMADAMPRCSVSNLVNENGGPFDWQVRSDLEVEVNADRYARRLFRIQVSCVDASGNRSTETVAVTVPAATERRAISN